MARIKTYTNDGTISDKDYLLGGDADNLDATKTYLLEDVRDYVLNNTNVTVVTLQDVIDEGNSIFAGPTVDKGINITLSNNSTLHQNGITVNIPQQTGVYPTYNPAPDAFVAILSGQNPGTLTGSPVGFLADMTGADNYGFIADLKTGSSTSVGFDSRSFDGHTGDLYLGAKYVSNVRTDVFKVDNDGDTTAKSFIKIGGTNTQYLMADGTVSTGGIGSQGPQGVQGPAGPLGPVGPAGLTWRGAWVSGTSYIANDAVGYNGASWFCILATSGTTTPNLATTNWALLASQGAQGIQGVQGPTGATGATGPAGTSGSGSTFKGSWDYTGNTTYAVGDIVTTFTYDNTFQYQMWGSYICITSNASNTNPGISNNWVQLGLTKIAKGARLKGVGTATEPIALKGYKRVGYIYANGTGNPIRSVNFFNGMELPPGVTETIVRVSTGTYELRYTALDGNTFVDLLGLDNFYEYSFDLNKNISYGGTFTTTSGGNRTLVLVFTNKVADVLTDGFSVVKYSFEWYEV